MGKTCDAVEKRVQEALKAGNMWVKISPVELAEMDAERLAEGIEILPAMEVKLEAVKKPAKKGKATNG